MSCGEGIAGKKSVLVQAEIEAKNGYKKLHGKILLRLLISDEKGSNSTEARCDVGV